VQYLGDVAIYIMPYRLDAFNDLRREIRRTCFRVADAVYKMRDAAGEPLYHSVIVVGHSLGSVVAYDALNQLIREEDSGSSATAGRSTVAERTHLFLTFGSPLDKTAFIFSLQGRNTSEPREALAASVQPMIRDYALRPRKWMNVWSPWDIISGHLAFYDEDPNGTNPRNVQNVVDPDATTPLVAHVEYWANPLIYRTIHAHL
jgi:pimeloyl-ACP methyl ester carboxylesterase